MVLVHLVCGWRGVGKTRWIGERVARKPKGERWQVWWPERAVVQLGSLGESGGEVRWRSLPSGCACCTGRIAFQMSFVRGLREDRPSRVWIEVGAGVDPKGILEVLYGEDLQATVTVGSVVALVDMEQWQQPRLRGHEAYLAHLVSADVLCIRQKKEDHDPEKSEVITAFRGDWREKHIVSWTDTWETDLVR